MSFVWTLRLLLAAVAVMASVPGSAAAGKPVPGPAALTGNGSAVTRFVCAHCTATGLLSSRGLFHNRAAVRRHIAASKPCRAADLGFREIHVDVRAGDVMAGGGGAAGPAPDVRHQPGGKHLYIYTTCELYSIYARRVVVYTASRSARDHWFDSRGYARFFILFCTRSYHLIPSHTFSYHHIPSPARYVPFCNIY
jgi:hypothetical protein